MAALEHGADAIGFVMGGRILPVEVEPPAQKVRHIIKHLPKDIESFIVTHLWVADDILALAEYVNSTGIQISEDIPLEELKRMRKCTKRKIIKTVVVNDEAEENLKKFGPYCDYILLDTRLGGYTGGTGVTNDWDRCRQIIALSDKPVYLAGGLNPENVASAVRKTSPAGVDVSTGVSTYSDEYLRKDRKDSDKIKRFIKISKETG